MSTKSKTKAVKSPPKGKRITLTERLKIMTEKYEDAVSAIEIYKDQLTAITNDRNSARSHAQNLQTNLKNLTNNFEIEKQKSKQTSIAHLAQKAYKGTRISALEAWILGHVGPEEFKKVMDVVSKCCSESEACINDLRTEAIFSLSKETSDGQFLSYEPLTKSNTADKN